MSQGDKEAFVSVDSAARKEKKLRDSLVGVWLLAVDERKRQKEREANREYAKARNYVK